MQQKDRKQMYRQQTMGYFINAALEIIEEEGIDSLSIRKTAEKAGYNSATLYHYFSDFEELRIFSAMKYLDQYAKDLPAYLEPVTRPLERYLKIWECFCLHSFSHPDIFWLLFFKHADTNWDFSYYFHAYYDIFPESWSEDAANYKNMLSSANFSEREFLSLTDSLNKENIFLPESDIHNLATMNIMLYRGMLETLREDSEYLTIEEATATTVSFIRRALTSYNTNIVVLQNCLIKRAEGFEFFSSFSHLIYPRMLHTFLLQLSVFNYFEKNIFTMPFLPSTLS